MNQGQIFLEYQSTLHSVALRILKCKAEAEDAVHDAFERWLSVDEKKIQNVKSYLIATVRNISLNKVRRLAFRKTHSLETVTKKEAAQDTEASYLDFEFDLKRALSLIQNKLEPLERVVVVLREVLNYDYDSLTRVVDKKAENCRQILSRAKRKLSNIAPTHKIDQEVNPLEEKFLESRKSGSFRSLVNYLKAEISQEK